MDYAHMLAIGVIVTALIVGVELWARDITNHEDK